jgi:predicted dehydrogenase
MLAARIPVLLEKPMARTVAQCHQLNEDAAKFNTLLMIAHCRRYDPYWTSWGAYVTEGKLGGPILWRDVRAGFSPGGWFMDDALGGGPLIDGAVHNYDFANWIFGEPESVLASGIQMNPAYSAIDTGSAIIRYRAGHQLLISWSWAVKGTTLPRRTKGAINIATLRTAPASRHSSNPPPSPTCTSTKLNTSSPVSVAKPPARPPARKRSKPSPWPRRSCRLGAPGRQ